MNHPKVFKYMEWCPKGDTDHRILNGNDMVLAMNKMVEKGDWVNFKEDCKVNAWFIFMAEEKTPIDFILFLMQPARFFDLMEKWLEVKK